ncbi:hypothetical protein GGR54DRAFT_1943 [Hypoxylon sp. NC1633]|nr:hypothetical protein GGR54DRAFT_1943 [Hypoxylon sp. NC1633]
MLLFARPEDWEDILVDNKPVFAEGRAPAEVLVPRATRADAHDMATTFKWLTRLVRFTFHDENEFDTSEAYGYTCSEAGYNRKGFIHLVVISLHICLIRPLLDTKTTTAERCLCLHTLAQTILHELMHAVYMCRTVYERGLTWEAEPFFYGEWAAELGWSMEHAIFGRVPQAKPNHLTRNQLSEVPIRVREGPIRALFSHHALEPYPGGDETVIGNDISTENWYYRQESNRIFQAGHTTTLWASSMLSEKYWQEVVSKERSKAFKPKPQLRYLYQRTMWKTKHSTPELADPNAKDEFTKRYRARIAEFNSLRPWYDTELAKWNSSPWSHTDGRLYIHRFQEAHAIQDRARADNTAMNFLNNLVRWTKMEEPLHFPSMMIWPYLYLSYLMTASIPYVEKEIPDTITTRDCTRLPSRTNPELKYMFQRQDTLGGCFASNTMPLIRAGFGRLESLRIGVTHPTPRSWNRQCRARFSDIWIDRQFNPTGWVRFDFDLPPYQPDTVWEKSLPNSNSWVPVTVPRPVVDDYSGFVMHRAPPMRGKPSGPEQEVETRTLQSYFSIGEIGDHKVLRNAWVVEPTENYRFDVYNITGILKTKGCTDDQFAHLTVLTASRCPTLAADNELAQQIRQEFGKTIMPIGQQWIERLPEEVAEHKSIEDSPLWVTFGTAIFDLSDFPFESEEERETVMKIHSDPLEPPEFSDDFADRITPYRCGTVKFPSDDPPPKPTPYTRLMIQWRDNPFLGIYVIVNDLVWDIAEYSNFFPGGRAAILLRGGTDATALVLRHHPDFMNGQHTAYVVGRVVPEIKLQDLSHNQIVLHSWIYNIESLEESQPQAYRQLVRCDMTDATDILTDLRNTGHNGEIRPSLMNLYLHHKNLIVGKLPDDPTKLREITAGELEQHSDADDINGAWTAVDEFVYDVTTIAQYPDFYERDMPQSVLGRVLDPYRAQWLATYKPARLIGRLVAGPAPPSPQRQKNTVKPTPVFAGGDERGSLRELRNLARDDEVLHRGGRQLKRELEGYVSTEYFQINEAGERVKIRRIK